MDFQAFTPSIILEGFQKRIDVIEAWGSKVLAGLADGSLVVLQSGDAGGNQPWQVAQALKQFAKKPMLQLQVITVLTLLLELHLCFTHRLCCREHSGILSPA